MALTEEERITLLAILAVVFILVVYFELRIMRSKSKAAQRISQRKDEAFNAILTCRSVINALQRQGSDVSEARSLVNKAKSHMDRGEHEIAIDLCERAREELTKARSVPRAISEMPVTNRVDPIESVAEEIVSRPRGRTSEDSYTGSRLDVQGGPNYLVAKFELGTAREEIAKAASAGLDVSESSRLVKKGQAEFDAGNYAKALSLAVKAKKAAAPQGADDTIPLRKSDAPVAPSTEIDGEAADVVEVCGSCGTALEADDDFCGSCGSKRAKERMCPSCGRVAGESDRFCRKCGTRVP